MSAGGAIAVRARSRRAWLIVFLAISSIIFGNFPVFAQEEGSKTLTPEQEEALFDVERGSRRPSTEGEEEEQGETPAQERSLDDLKNREQLKEAGFRFGENDDSRRRSTAILMALFPGMLLHGAGHLYLGDQEETVLVLSLMELGGIGLMGAGAAIPWLSEGRLGGGAVSRPLFYTGMGLILSSYVIDVVGVTRGDTPLIYASPLMRLGVSAELGYRFMDTDYYPLRNVIAGRLATDFGAGFLSGETMQDVSLLTSRYSGEFGWRLFRMRDTEHQVAISARGDWLQLRDVGRFRRAEALLMAGGVLDMGVVSPHLRRLYVGLRAGYGYQWYGFPLPRTPEADIASDDPSELAWSQRVGVLPVELFGGMSFSDKFHVQLSYTRHDGEFLNDVNRLFGVPAVRMDYRSGRNFDLTFRGEYGAGFALQAGLRIWIFEPGE